LLPLQSLIRRQQQVGDLPSAASDPPSPPAALTAARVASAGPGRATFTGPASDGEPLTVQVAAVVAGVVRVSLSRDGSPRPRSEATLPLVREPARAGAGPEAADAAAGEVRVRAGDLVAVVSPDPWSLRFEDGGGRTLLAQRHRAGRRRGGLPRQLHGPAGRAVLRAG
jgi:alpha-D-xyloside xylohydrolase